MAHDERAAGPAADRTAAPAGLDVPRPPTGLSRARWVGPGVLWTLAALATGELLFTPRVGSQYGYALVWALVLALALKLAVTREIGRYTVVTGRKLLDGYSSLPGPGRWAVWAILLPQLVVGVASIAGISSAAGSALTLALPGPIQLWTLVVIASTTALVLWGRYAGVEKVARVFGVALALGAVVAALLVGPDVGEAAGGLVPTIPSDLAVVDILPWLGFLSNGAAGLMWYSYWVAAKGVGTAGVEGRTEGARPDEQDVARLRGWLRTMSLDSGLAVAVTGVITLAFLVLGAELLRPEGIVPAEDDVARDLSTLFSEVFGSVGFWFIVIGMVSAFWTATLTNQDGWQRLYTDGIRRVLEPAGLHERRWAQPSVLSTVALVGWLALLPAGVFLVFGDPVALLTVAGSIEAVHIPLVAALTLWLNTREVPAPLRAGKVAAGLVVLATVFFTAFAGFYLVQQLTG